MTTATLTQPPATRQRPSLTPEPPVVASPSGLPDAEYAEAYRKIHAYARACGCDARLAIGTWIRDGEPWYHRPLHRGALTR